METFRLGRASEEEMPDNHNRRQTLTSWSITLMDSANGGLTEMDALSH